MDKIILKDIVFFAQVGVPEEERTQEQVVIAHVELGINVREAAAGDDLSRSVDYEAAREEVRKVGSAHPYRLVETMAEEVAAALLAKFPIEQTVVRLRKRDLTGPEGPIYAAVEITRHRNA